MCLACAESGFRFGPRGLRCLRLGRPARLFSPARLGVEEEEGEEEEEEEEEDEGESGIES